MYTVFNEGPGPKGLYNKDGRVEIIQVGQRKTIDLADDYAAIIARRDGSIRIELTDKQAAKINTPVPDPIDIPEDWPKLPWVERRRLAVAVSGNRKIKTAEEVRTAISKAQKDRS